MRILVLSCNAYSDAWTPFFTLFRKFWPNCPYPVWLATDDMGNHGTIPFGPDHTYTLYGNVTWNQILAGFCREYDDEPIMLFLEDYFLTSTPNLDLIRHAVAMYTRYLAACVRLYPCPGGVGAHDNFYFAKVAYDEPYRVSTQVAIWRPDALRTIAEMTDSPQAFELTGSKQWHGGPVFAFRREVQPWPIEYICTAIVRGVWQTGALEWCAKHGITVDTSRRPVAVEGQYKQL